MSEVDQNIKRIDQKIEIININIISTKDKNIKKNY